MNFEKSTFIPIFLEGGSDSCLSGGIITVNTFIIK